MSGNDMKLVVVGAAGRMGQALIRLIHETPGVQLHAAVSREDLPLSVAMPAKSLASGRSV